jgi:hypothetical protein
VIFLGITWRLPPGVLTKRGGVIPWTDAFATFDMIDILFLFIGTFFAVSIISLVLGWILHCLLRVSLTVILYFSKILGHNTTYADRIPPRSRT